MSQNKIYQPYYEKSFALIIGINAYQKTFPLGYACNDANAVSQLLCGKLSFPSSNVTVLIDSAATKSGILSAFFQFTLDTVGPNDQVLIFFAGHGYTKAGGRGEVGFLVPVDGSPEDLSSLIRWDDLTRNAEFISAKHVLFIMDACYGGLALTRSVPHGSMRFARDMMQRPARQVLTAGKADELVSDAGGPRPGHSVFTGHLLNALDGAAAMHDGLLTANGIMTYVYDKVAKDYQSRQTPHYGFIDGDGDFIFNSIVLNQLGTEPEIGRDVLIEVPPVLDSSSTIKGSMNLQDQVKEYISDSKSRIKLDDLVAKEIRRVQYLTQNDNFPTHTSTALDAEFVERLKRYENIVTDLQSIVALIAKWGGAEHKSTLEKIFARIAETDEAATGMTVWLELRWYPILLLLYTGGIAALAAQEYENLATMLMTRVGTRLTGNETHEIILQTVDNISSVSELFKTLPGHERNYMPRSEYMFKLFQPLLEDLLFLGKSYESLYDKFEVFLALVYVDLTYKETGHVWGPTGRFGWKYRSERQNNNPFVQMIDEAAYYQDSWLPLKAGFFLGSYERFKQISTNYEEQVLKHLRRH